MVFERAERIEHKSEIGLSKATLLLVLGVGIGFFLSTIFVVVGTISDLGFHLATLKDLLTKSGLLIGTMMLIIPAIYYVRRTGRPFTSTFRLNRVRFTTILLTLLLSIGLIIITDSLDRLIAPFVNGVLDKILIKISPGLTSDHILEQLQNEFRIRSFLSGALLILSAVLAAGFCEEMLVRGMFQKALEAKHRALWAILISSLVFSLIHLNPWGAIQIFIIAAVLGYVAWVTNSIIPTIIIHALNNLTVIVFTNVPEDSLAWYATQTQVRGPVILAGLVFAVCGIIGFHLEHRRSRSPKLQ